ncbi:MAG: hypothetical protein U0841_26975 [Chloroflexia bacterium]
METFQSILMAECAVRERQERAERANDYDYVVMHDAQEPALRETVASALIALALWLAPNQATRFQVTG